MRHFTFSLSLALALSLVLVAPKASAQDSQKLSLDGDQDYATAPDSPEISFEGSSNVNMTIEAWIKHDGQGDPDARIFDKLDDRNYGYDLHLAGSGGEVPVQFTLGGNRTATITSNTGVPAGRWTHVAVTYDGSTLSLYLNGKLDNTVNRSREIWDGNASPHIGTNKTAGGNFFSGAIDELRIWTVTRTAAQIRENRFSSLSGSESGIVAYYPFDSGSPTADQSGNGHSLTLKGDATTENRDALPVPPDLYIENEGNEQVRLRWQERTGPNGENAADNFTVYRSPSTGLSGRSQIAQPGASGDLTYTASSLSNGKTYFWEVTAEDGSGSESDFSPVMTGTPHDGNEPTPLKGGSALALDGAGDYGTVGNRPSLSVTGDSITVEAWVKHDGESDEDAFILHKRGSNGYGYILRLVGSGEEVPVKFTHEGNRAQSITSNAGVPADRWTHVAVVSDMDELRLYLNGELNNSVNIDNGIWDNDEPLRIGTNRAEDGRFFSGRVDEVRIWSDARTETEIRDQYRDVLTGGEAGLRGYFRFNDGRKSVRQGTSTGATERRASVTLTGDASVEGPGVFPLPPRLYARAGDASIDLSWAERRSGEASEFRIYRATSPDGSDRNRLSTQGASTTSYTDDGASNATNTFHEVTTVNGDGQESDYAHPAPTTPSTRHFGNALELGGSGDYGTVGDRSSLMPTGDSLTVEAWVRHDGTSDEDAYILHKRGSNGYGYGMHLVGSGDEVSVKFFHEGNRARGITSNASITAGEWTHVAVVWDGSEMRLYLDGELDNSVSDDKKIWNNDEPLRIGTNRTEDARFFSGRIEEVRIWDDARSETEIRQHRLRELWGSEEQLSAYFRFNETPGTAVSRAAAERPKTVRLNGNANFAPSRSLYPSTLTATVSRSFDSAANAADYRLVALPGQVDRPLTDAISGEAGIDWQAYHDDGSNSDFLQKYDGSDTFNFEPGTGFWLTSTSDWTHEVDVSTVSLRGDTAAVIGLRDGWNIISNPMGRPVPYDRISTANRAAASGSLQPLWAFDGTFSQADSMHSAVQGVAYYFLNDQGLDSLRVPYPGTSGTKRSTDSDDAKRGLRLVASFAEKEEEASASTVGLRLGTGNGPERKNVVAPPSRFESVSLRIVSEEAEGRSARRRLLMRTQRSTDEGGTTVDLQLTSRMDGAVRLSAENVDGLRGREVRLLVPSKGTSHDLNVNEEVVINPSSEEENLQLAVGTKRYVDERTEAVRPDEVSLRTYPNPVRQQGTIEYALPEAETVTLRIYDVLGREVATIVDARKEAGRHTARLATDQLSSGVYFGRLQAGEQRLTRKITVVR